MEKYKVIKILEQNTKVILDTKYNRAPNFVYVYGMPDIQVGDTFCIIQDKYGYDLAYICRDNLCIQRVPPVQNIFAIDTFDKNFKSVAEFSLDRWYYERALKRAVKKLGLTPKQDTASNLRIWMSNRKGR